MKKSITLFFLMAASTMAFAAPGIDRETKAADDVYTSPGKPQHPLKVEFDWNADAKAGEPLDVSMQVSSGFEIHDVRVSVRTSDALLLESQPEQYLQKPSPDKGDTVSLRVTPMRDGIHEVRIRVTAMHGDAVWSREITKRIPIGVEDHKEPRYIEPAKTVIAADGVEEHRVKARQSITYDN